MANNLEMEVIAEGVETEEQRSFLELHGCPQCQWYLFSKPVPLEDFEELLKRGWCPPDRQLSGGDIGSFEQDTLHRLCMFSLCKVLQAIQRFFTSPQDDR